MKITRRIVSATLAFLILLGVGRITLRLLVSGPSTLFIDFGVYYQAGEYALEGQSLFSADYSGIPNTASRWLYPPIFVVIFIPFVPFSYLTAAVLWVMVTALILFLSVMWLADKLYPELEIWEKAIIGLAVLAFPPILSALFLGQVTPLITAILCIYTVCLLKNNGNTIVTGAVAAIAAAIKPTYLPIGAPLLRNPRRLVGAIIAGSVPFLVGLAFFGVDQHLTYLEVLQSGKGWGESSHLPPSEWRTTTYAPWYFLFPYHLIANVAVVLTTISVTLYTWGQRDRATELYVLSLGLLTVPLATPSPGILALSTLVPGILVLTALELRTSAGRPEVPLFAGVLIAIHPFTIEFLAGDLTRGLPVVGSIAEIFLPALPLLSPAVWGSLILFSLPLWRLLHESGGTSSEHQNTLSS